MVKSRLLILARALERFKPTERRKFNLATWKLRTRGCGTQACAAGLAASLPELKRLGLSLETNYSIERQTCYVPKYRRYSAWDAIEKFFGLSPDEAFHLFAYDHYDDPRDPVAVATRIREFVAL